MNLERKSLFEKGEEEGETNTLGRTSLLDGTNNQERRSLLEKKNTQERKSKSGQRTSNLERSLLETSTMDRLSIQERSMLEKSIMDKKSITGETEIETESELEEVATLKFSFLFTCYRMN